MNQISQLQHKLVSEQSSNVNFNIDESSDVEQSKYLQSYEIECTYNSSNTIDPFSNIYLLILSKTIKRLISIGFLDLTSLKENKINFLQIRSNV